jgi:hypothetical protein
MAKKTPVRKAPVKKVIAEEVVDANNATDIATEVPESIVDKATVDLEKSEAAKDEVVGGDDSIDSPEEGGDDSIDSPEEGNEDSDADEEIEVEKAPKSALEKLTDDKPSPFSSISLMLGEYIDGMAPNIPQTPDSISKNQMKLRAIINGVLNMKEENFDGGMKGLIVAVREYRTKAFAEHLVFRGFAQLRVPRAERQKLESLVSLLLASADSNNPKQISDVVDLDVLLKHVGDNGHHQKLQSFFS